MGEINSLKICQKYNIPIFVLLGLEDDRSKKEVRLGYVQSYNDKQKTFLISFIDDKEKVLRYLRMIKEENKRMHAQVENVLRISKLEKNEIDVPKERIELHDIVEDAITPSAIRDDNACIYLVRARKLTVR